MNVPVFALISHAKLRLIKQLFMKFLCYFLQSESLFYEDYKFFLRWISFTVFKNTSKLFFLFFQSKIKHYDF
jgi:hypothetical protein